MSSLGIRDVRIVGRSRRGRARYGLEPHVHEGMMEICYLAEGAQVFCTRQRMFVMGPGDFFVSFPDEVHDTGGEPMQRSKLYWVQVRFPRAGRPFLGLTGARAAPLVRALRRMRVRLFPGTPDAAAYLDAVVDSAGRSVGPLSRVRTENHLLRFLLDVVACSRSADARSTPSPPIRRALDCIETDLGGPLAPADLARAARLSVSRLKARFRKEVGIPPADYVLRRRVERSKRLLKVPGASVTSVAMDLGFSSSQYFATVFKRYTSITPRAWRRRNV
jgi:AraC-like DNA-binding protein